MVELAIGGDGAGGLDWAFGPNCQDWLAKPIFGFHAR
jgi:hypothetical protein